MTPPIPQGSPYFIKDAQSHWNFVVWLPSGERRYQALLDLPDIPAPELRSYIAAVAVAHWEREARRYQYLGDYMLNCCRMFDHPKDNYPYGKLQGAKMWAYAECMDIFRDMCANVRAWKQWGGWL